MEYLEVICMRDVDVGRLGGRCVGIGVHQGTSLKEVLSDQVREVLVANPLTKTMEAMWIVWSYSK
jgi:hypothetical protein